MISESWNYNPVLCDLLLKCIFQHEWRRCVQKQRSEANFSTQFLSPITPFRIALNCARGSVLYPNISRHVQLLNCKKSLKAITTSRTDWQSWIEDHFISYSSRVRSISDRRWELIGFSFAQRLKSKKGWTANLSWRESKSRQVPLKLINWHINTRAQLTQRCYCVSFMHMCHTLSLPVLFLFSLLCDCPD